MKSLSNYIIFLILLTLHTSCEDSVNKSESSNDGGNNLHTGSPIFEGKNVYIA